MTDRLQTVLSEIDAFNEQDPQVEFWEGANRPRERVYSERLSRWIDQLRPESSEFLRIAARGQHIGRWKIPRDVYPMDRGGYLRWREDLKRFHATTVIEMMEKGGYTAAECDRVRLLILKKNIAGDPETQTLEDALCLVFLETQFEELKRKTANDKMIEIIRKTWRKMSPQGHKAALELPLPPSHVELIQSALNKT